MIRKRVTCAVIIKAGRVLLARRAPGQKNAGLWEFPGGKVEAGETDEACLEREILEEFGVRGKACAHICDSAYTYNEFGMQILLCAYVFVPESDAFELRVHDEVRYFAPQELADISLSPADVPIAEAVGRLITAARSSCAAQ